MYMITGLKHYYLNQNDVLKLTWDSPKSTPALSATPEASWQLDFPPLLHHSLQPILIPSI